ncbi:MAG TPA: hypothetical protein VGC41_28355 [Kofleriaceae bacterium]
MKTVLQALLVACASKKAAVHRHDDGAVVVVEKKSLLADSTQLVTAVPETWTSTTVMLRLFERSRGEAWHVVGEPWPAMIGATGAAWGIGVHGDATGHGGPKKIEGDRKAPAGAFALRGVYGYAMAPPDGVKLPYTPSIETTKCVDDPASLHYASIVGEDTPRDWHSAEDMHRKDAMYTWVVDVAHNPSRLPGDGSCIFLHVWKDDVTPTVGCTAMAEPQLRDLIGKLNPARKPLYVLLPREEYTALAPTWGLPPL